MSAIIIHIPHASIHIPTREYFLIDDDRMQEELNILTDWYTDDLFGWEGREIKTTTDLTYHYAKAGFSRIFCDVERFSDDKQEVMAAFGMGVLYEKTDSGHPMRNVDEVQRQHILSNYYHPHHNELEQLVVKQLQESNRALLIDAHSFPHTPLKRDLNQKIPRPDFNIGTDAFHTPQVFIDASVSFFNDRGYSLGIDWPYQGTIVPMTHYRNDDRVQSIMLEINRDLYMKKGTIEKGNRYSEIKQAVQEYLEMIGSV